MHTVSPSLSQAVSASESPFSTPRPKAVFMLDQATHPLIYGAEDCAELFKLADVAGPVIGREVWPNHPGLLSEAEIIFSGWGAPLMDAAFLRAAPKLKAVFYGAGSVRSFVTDAFWDRGIVITSSYAANAVPVAEYTLATTLLSLKQFWQRSAAARLGEGWGDHTRPIPGSFRATVGLVSFGMIARNVAQLLKQFDMRVIVYCPFLTEQGAVEAGVEKVSLAELFKRADVVSVHSPVLPETIGLINGVLVASMKTGATLINTARGKILAQGEAVEVLRVRPDLTAILDVTDPEPPTAADALFTLPNVTVTSHIAGSHGSDCQRLGHYMVDEFRRYTRGEPLRWQLTRAMVERMA